MPYETASVRERLAAVRVDPAVASVVQAMLAAVAGPDGRVSAEDATRLVQIMLDEALAASRPGRGAGWRG